MPKTFKEYLNEAKNFIEGDSVKFDGETWEVIEVIGKDKLKIVNKSGKSIVTLFKREVEKVK